MSITTKAINATAIALFAGEYLAKTMYPFLAPSYGIPEQSPCGLSIINSMPIQVCGFNNEYDKSFNCAFVTYQAFGYVMEKIFVSKRFGKFNRYLIKMAILHEEGHYLCGHKLNVRENASELEADMNAIRGGNRVEKLAFGGFLVYSLLLSIGSKSAIVENYLRLKQLWSNL